MSGVPGGPVGSVEWLRRNLEAYALSLRPRQLVLTGTPLGLYPVRPGDAVRVTAERLGSVPFPPRLREGVTAVRLCVGTGGARYPSLSTRSNASLFVDVWSGAGRPTPDGSSSRRSASRSTRSSPRASRHPRTCPPALLSSVIKCKW